MERYQYIVAGSTKQEKTIWICAQCKKANMDSILLGQWKLIGRNDTGDIVCDVCGSGMPKAAQDMSQPLPSGIIPED